MINIQGLTFRYSEEPILNGLNLSIRTGDFYALAGENGAGKTTLIRILLDLIRNIDAGQITIDGRDRTDRRAREKLIYLPEKFDLPPDVTGWQYLCFVTGVYRESLDRARIHEFCERMSLDTDRLDDRTRSYSKGMKQKLGLISCFMLHTPLIILDEPLSGLDPKARYCFKQLLQSERDRGRTLFYSTHLLADAEEICDRFGILHGGRLLFDGTPEQALQTFSAETLETAYMKAISQP